MLNQTTRIQPLLALPTLQAQFMVYLMSAERHPRFGPSCSIAYSAPTSSPPRIPDWHPPYAPDPSPARHDTPPVDMSYISVRRPSSSLDRSVTIAAGRLISQYWSSRALDAFPRSDFVVMRLQRSCIALIASLKVDGWTDTRAAVFC